MNKEGAKSYWSRVIDALWGHRSREILVFLFFLCVSFGFWLLQTLNESFETEIRVPLVLSDIPDNVVVTTEPPAQLVVTLRDRGTSLMRFFRERERMPLELDFRKRDDGALNARVLLTSSELMRTVQAHFNGATAHILSVKPDTVEYYYNRGLPVRLAVKACGEISTSPQNYLQGISFSPDSVSVYAPTAILDTMMHAYTQPLDMTGLTENASATVSLRGMKGVKYEPETVGLTALVGYYTEKTVEVPIKGLNFPADKELRTFPSSVRVTFRVGSSMYQKVTSDNFVIAPTYEELLQNPYSKYRPHLRSMPDGVSNVRISPIEVDYLIEHVITEDTKL